MLPHVPVALSYLKLVCQHPLSLILVTTRHIEGIFVVPFMNPGVWRRKWRTFSANAANPNNTVCRLTKFAKSERLFQRVHFEIVGRHSQFDCFTYIFNALCRFTRWATVCQINNNSAKQIALVLLDRWISYFFTQLTIATVSDLQS